MMKNPVRLILMLIISSGFTACHKPDPQPVVEPEVFIPDFTYTGKPYIYSPITFTSNLTTNKDITWYFSDKVEKTVNGKGITYAYDSPGTYKVTMAIADGSGAVVSKTIIISYGADRISGKQDWNFFLKRTKVGAPLTLIPSTSFSSNFALDIVNDTTIQIPDIPQMRFRGPYTVKKYLVTDSNMIYKSEDMLIELSYMYGNFTGGMQIIQVSKDTTWKLNGFATIYN